MEATQGLMTIEETASVLRIGRSTLYELMSQGEIEFVHIGASRRVVAESVTRYIEKLRGRTAVPV